MSADLDDARPSSGPRLGVFAPSPLFTITVEDGRLGRAEVHFHAGGQGFWVARMACVLGVSTVLCGPFAGESGRVLKLLIEAAGVRVRATGCSAPNGGYLHDRRDGERRVIASVASAELSRHETDDLYNAALTTCLAAGFAVLTGPAHPSVLSADVYRRMALDLDANGARVVADLSGSALRALAGGVELLKVSHEELIEAGFACDARVASLLAGAQVLRERGSRNVIVSRADEPALALLEEQWVELRGPQLHPADSRGAGDSMTAAVAAGLARGLSLYEAARLGAAAAALNVTRHGLATGDRLNIEALLERVEVAPLRA
jgi:1-phosphofructokinase